MSQSSFKIADEEMEWVRKEAKRNSRSVSGQITHWLRLGRAIESSGTFSHQRVQQALDAELPLDGLSAKERSVYFDDLHRYLANPPVGVDAAYAELLEGGPCVGLDEAGGLVESEPE